MTDKFSRRTALKTGAGAVALTSAAGIMPKYTRPAHANTGLASGMTGGPTGFPGAERYQYNEGMSEGRAIEGIKKLKAEGKAPSTISILLTDGAIGPLIGDILETGADILNPVQTSTTGMADTAALKAQWGDTLAFHGAIDVQQMMPNATRDQLSWEIARRMSDLGSDGGYILAPCHNLGHDIPPESTIALFDMAREMGRYPLTLDNVLATGASYFAGAETA